MASTDWKLVTKQLPDTTEDRWVTLIFESGDRAVDIDWYGPDSKQWNIEINNPHLTVLAWMDVPPPFEPDPYAN